MGCLILFPTEHTQAKSRDRYNMSTFGVGRSVPTTVQDVTPVRSHEVKNKRSTGPIMQPRSYPEESPCATNAELRALEAIFSQLLADVHAGLRGDHGPAALHAVAWAIHHAPRRYRDRFGPALCGWAAETFAYHEAMTQAGPRGPVRCKSDSRAQEIASPTLARPVGDARAAVGGGRPT